VGPARPQGIGRGGPTGQRRQAEDIAAAPFLPLLVAGPIEQDPSHGFGRCREKMSAILPVFCLRNRYVKVDTNPLRAIAANERDPKRLGFGSNFIARLTGFAGLCGLPS
jgi:hypothetical protein